MERSGWSGPHRAPLVTLAALVILLLRETLLQGRFFYYRDLHLQFYPQMEALVRVVTSGSWPLWYPDASFGRPILANPNNQVLYPLTWLNLLMRPWSYYNVYAAFHILLAGTGMYALACRLSLSRGASTLAAALWTTSGPLLSLVNLWNHLAAAAWMPWAFLAADVTLASGRLRPAILWGITLAAPILGGSPDLAILTAVAAFLHGIRHLRDLPVLGREMRKRLLASLAAGAFALALSAAQWIPSLEAASLSGRTDLPSFVRTYWSVPPLLAAQIVIPLYLDRFPIHAEIRSSLYEGREPFLGSLYVGLPSLLLVLWSLGLHRRGRGPSRLFFFGLALAALLFTLGLHTPLYRATLALIPPLRAMRYPPKAMVLFSLAWALLAATGWESWRDASRKRLSWTVPVPLVGGSCILLAAAVAGLLHWGAEEWGSALLFRGQSSRSFSQILAPGARSVALAAGFAALTLSLACLLRHRRQGRALVGVLAVADLLFAHASLNATAPRELFSFRPPLLEEIRQRAHGRLYVYDYSYPGKAVRHLGHRTPFLTVLPEEHWPAPWYEALTLRSYLYPSLLPLWGLSSAFERDSLWLYPTYLEDLTSLMRAAEGTPAHPRLLQMGGVSHVVALHAMDRGHLNLEATVPSPFVEPIGLFRVADPLPRSSVVSGVRVADGPAALAILGDAGFHPRDEVVLTTGLPKAKQVGFEGATRLLVSRPDRLIIETEASGPGHLVLLDAYDPGWRATLDGRDVAVLRANVAFRAVAVPAGRHRVELRYRPTSVAVGVWLSAATVGLAAVTLGRRRRERHAP